MTLNPSAIAVVLTFVAGSVDGLSLIVLGRFSSHMSGTTSSFVHDMMQSQLAFGTAAFGVLVAFVSGALLTGLVLADLASDTRKGRLPLLLVTEALCLTIAGLAGGAGPNGVAVILGMAPFAMGVQNAASSLCLGDRVRTTHLTGTLTDFGAAVGRLIRARGSDADKPSVHEIVLSSAARLSAFVAGGAFGGMVFTIAGKLGLLAPSLVLLACASWLSLNSRTPRALSSRSRGG